MKLSVTSVPIRKIKPSVSRWNFSEEAVEQAARLVAKLEGIINPLVLRRESNSETYEVLDGNFEYYVAARASELEPRTCETIAAFIIEPEDETIIHEQIDWFRSRRNFDKARDLPSTTDSENRLKQLEYRQSELESRQRLLEQRVMQSIPQQQEAGSDKKTTLLAAFNELESTALLQRMRQAGLMGRNAEKIVEAVDYERQQQHFRSLKEVVLRVKGLTYEKIVDLLEAS